MSLRLVKRNKSSKAVWRWGRGCPRKCLVAPLQPPRSRQSGSPTPNAHSTGWGVGAGACFGPARQPHGVEGSGQGCGRRLRTGAFGGSAPKAQAGGARPGRLVAAPSELDPVLAALTGLSRVGFPHPAPLPLSEQVLRADVSAPAKPSTLFLNGSQLG